MSNSTTIIAKTYTCNYIEKEDRLLLTINYKDIENRIDFWITRAFFMKLLPYFFDYATIEPDKTTYESYNRDTTDTSTFVLTQQKAILLESIDFSPLENGGMKLVFKNLEKNIHCIGILDKNLFKSIVELLTKVAPRYDWGFNSIF